MARSMYFEKRRHKRVNTVVMADLFTLDMRTLLARAVISDVGIGGIQVETKEPLDVKEEFALRFYLPNGMGFDRIRAIIRSTRRDAFAYVYGIEFLHLRWMDRLRLWWFITTRAN